MAANQDEDITIFADHCVFMRSIYLHSKTLFEHSSVEERERMSRVANVFFGDLNRVLIEYMILQVCKITDPAKDFRNNDNHTTAFLLSHYDLAAEPQKAQQCATCRPGCKRSGRGFCRQETN